MDRKNFPMSKVSFMELVDEKNSSGLQFLFCPFRDIHYLTFLPVRHLEMVITHVPLVPDYTVSVFISK